MNVMGMGVMELGVVFLIAFLVLGPSRSIDMARSAGKLIGDLRRSFNDVLEAVNFEQEQEKGPSGRVPVDQPVDQPVNQPSEHPGDRSEGGNGPEEKESPEKDL